MVDVYIIIGNMNTRKSATVRALTGARVQGIYSVATQVNNIDVWVELRSLQENDMSPHNFLARINQEININPHINHILVPLRLNNAYGQPGAIDYINEFLLAGWNINNVVIMGGPAPHLPAGVLNQIIILNPNYTPANAIAAQIRPSFNWL